MPNYVSSGRTLKQVENPELVRQRAQEEVAERDLLASLKEKYESKKVEKVVKKEVVKQVVKEVVKKETKDAKLEQ